MMRLFGKKILVVGIAKTGLACVRFLKSKGAIVTTSEIKKEDEMKDIIEELKDLDIMMEWGGHRTETFLSQDMIVVSPGVDLNIEPIRQAMKKGIKVISEIELAYHFIDSPIIAITGTNGKTTTTTLLGEILREDGKKVGVGGNVGEPLILFTDGNRWEVLVVEISSFQLEAIEKFRPNISILLNITEDHLDRYERYLDYIEAKKRIFMNQGPDDIAILNYDDPVVIESSRGINSKKVFFSLKKRLEEGAFSDGEYIYLKLYGNEEVFPLKKTNLKGIHNVENMMAALLGAKIFGCKSETIKTVLSRFKGLEHRLEFVSEINGIKFYNDSKGTNVGSVVKSIQSFSEPLILIAGGRDKRGDLSPLKDLIKKKVKSLILIGEARERMAKELGDLTETFIANSLEEAVNIAFKGAERGDVVLLSPGCSSFDMFRDYKERGMVFKDLVYKLIDHKVLSQGL